MSVKELVITNKGLGVKYAEEVLTNSNRPMSPRQIKTKFQLSFPFTVVRVVPGQGARTCCNLADHLVGAVITFIKIRDDGGYVVSDICPSVADIVMAIPEIADFNYAINAHAIDPDSERFVLSNDK